MAKALEEIHSQLDGSEGVGRHRVVRAVDGAYLPADEDDAETDRERAARRRECHGIWKKDCNECRAVELARALRHVRDTGVDE